MNDFTNFRAVFDELTDEVGRSRYQFLPDHLRGWFEHIDQTPKVSQIVLRLQGDQDFSAWYEVVSNNGGSFVGSAQMDWPKERENALGMKLLLFRACASGQLDLSMVGYTFIYVGNNVNDNARAVVEQVFMPMASELRRYLEREVPKLDDVAPASDRVVKLDHNEPKYMNAVQELENLATTLKVANDFDDAEEMQQRIAEVSAARRLMDAVRVRVEPMLALLRPLIVQYANKLKDNLIGMAVLATVAALTAVFGRIFQFFF